jgi:hypothetical protein
MNWPHVEFAATRFVFARFSFALFFIGFADTSFVFVLVASLLGHLPQAIQVAQAGLPFWVVFQFDAGGLRCLHRSAYPPSAAERQAMAIATIATSSHCS